MIETERVEVQLVILGATFAIQGKHVSLTTWKTYVLIFFSKDKTYIRRHYLQAPKSNVIFVANDYGIESLELNSKLYILGDFNKNLLFKDTLKASKDFKNKQESV